MHRDENKQQWIGHEILLTVIAKGLIILAYLLVDLYWLRVNGLLANKGRAEPDDCPDPIAKGLNEKIDKSNFFSLCFKWIFSWI